MGFVDYASSLIKKNRILQENVRSRYFRQKSNTPSKTDSKVSKTLRQLNPEKLAKANKNRKIALQLTSILVLAIVGSFIFLKYSGKVLYTYQNNNAKQLELIRSEAESNRKIESYHLLIKFGIQDYSNGQLNSAQDKFQSALNLFPNGKEANLGITKCLISRCSKNGEYCDEANTYVELMLNSTILNKEEKGTIEELISSWEHRPPNNGF